MHVLPGAHFGSVSNDTAKQALNEQREHNLHIARSLSTGTSLSRFPRSTICKLCMFKDAKSAAK